ncbi:hypothetical protein [Bradyrhizobium sp.]|uniref:hypothetical protein n=1 Tax=Bradyrhizobium sp. TaxID=376 RepID=UPI0023966EF4|nr:hypothetical protein [Bradyrhizobium sp.]MDE2379763.1 hypothetical protein [Bradyrhizobium sp.]
MSPITTLLSAAWAAVAIDAAINQGMVRITIDFILGVPLLLFWKCGGKLGSLRAASYWSFVAVAIAK